VQDQFCEPLPPEPKFVRGTLEYVGEQVRLLRLHMERCHKKMALLEQSLSTLANPAESSEEPRDAPANACELQHQNSGRTRKTLV
jgi:hypothetical protein